MTDPTALPGAGGVVFDPQGRVLVLKHQHGSWVFPKGHIDPGETALGAALREVEEEGGVRAALADPNPDETRYRNDRGESRRITWFVLRAEASPPVLREALFTDAAFLPPEEALSRLSFDADRALLRRLLARRALAPADASGGPEPQP